MKRSAVNQIAYRKLKPQIDRRYPPNRFVAIADGRIVADASDFDELQTRLQKIGKDARDTLVVQAGVTYPDNVTIFL
jgi:hypothetical protein